MRIIKCNKCGKVKKEKSAAGKKWISGSLDCGYTNDGYGYIDFDLCEKCSGKLERYIKDYLGIKKKTV